MFNYIVYRIGQFITLYLPLNVAYKIAIFFSDLHYIFANKDRRRIKENLNTIFPKKSSREIRRLRIRMVRNFAKYVVDFFRCEKLDKEYIAKYIKIENMHYFDQALSRGKGVIVLTAHLGNWELGGVVLALLDYPLWVVARPHKDKLVDNFFNFQRQRKGVNVIPLGKAVRASLNLLKENKMVALAGDRDFTEKGIIMDFFGKPTILPEGPAALALKTGASIVPGFMLRNENDEFTLRIEKPLEFSPTGDKKKDLSEIILRYKNIFEDYIRKYPDQWYMFRRFWIEK
ncbi:MAG: lysophospholipid acyltransferase family protein [Candidatus Omnitrophica bacterium]|nr:lysophospholipid acyltransferase family protein [Candidatus Omnitrophota bacterium]